jgi:hypothetical protein
MMRQEGCNHCDSPLPKAPPWSGIEATDPGVEGCDHRWITVRVGDVQAHPFDPDERMVYCKRCHVPRCGHSYDPDPCLLARHHRTEHVYASGAVKPVGT